MKSGIPNLYLSEDEKKMERSIYTEIKMTSLLSDHQSRTDEIPTQVTVSLRNPPEWEGRCRSNGRRTFTP